jgi:hypothetical protein
MAVKVTDTRRLETERFYLTIAYSLSAPQPQTAFQLEILGTSQISKKDLLDLKEIIGEAIAFSESIEKISDQRPTK